MILIVAVALYLHFYPNETLTNFYHKQKQFLVNEFGKFSDTKLRLKANKIYLDLENDLANFSEKEIKHLKEITASRDNVKAFHLTFCKTAQRDIDFHINNQKKVCATINRHVKML
ncbi:hypothetical protein FCS21_01360 [Colwellia ponticola]|uniref:Uncharacterized protein n=1 Tax=Colwellia ponticola TaxID=2304625 RepID=A0A8H2JPR3_9GAMM|nr:hypothetical protein FCS21_01360 [Colwellia ponticola]